MTRAALAGILVFSLAGSAAAVPAGYELVLEDEFEGSELDGSIWEHRLPGPRRDAVNTPDAVQLDGDGHLVIDTWTESGTHYTGMIGTQGLFEQRYGWFEARIDFDDAPGMWSAFWLQTPDMGSFIGDPGRAGVEMDIVEHDLFNSVAAEPIWHGALHWDGYGSDHKISNHLEVAPDIGDGFHTYALEWTPTALRFYYDDTLMWDASAGPISHRAEYLILSSEVEDSLINRIPAGGYGDRASSTTRMVVDSVRVYRAVPEPASGSLLALAFAAALVGRRRGSRPVEPMGPTGREGRIA
ncbi:MAG: glycoside hydrolase family 16 protein [Myxococcota bacterium]